MSRALTAIAYSYASNTDTNFDVYCTVVSHFTIFLGSFLFSFLETCSLIGPYIIPDTFSVLLTPTLINRFVTYLHLSPGVGSKGKSGLVGQAGMLCLWSRMIRVAVLQGNYPAM